MQNNTDLNKPILGGYDPGNLEIYLIDFFENLKENGFSYRSIRAYTRSVSHFCRWLQKNNIELIDINAKTIKIFSKHKCHCKSELQRKTGFNQKYVRRVEYFVNFLCHKNVISYYPLEEKSILPKLVENYISYSTEMGLTKSTIDHYKVAILEILSIIGINPKLYNKNNIHEVICSLSKTNTISFGHSRAKALRSYLRFLSIKGLVDPYLIYAVPRHAQWSNSSIPKFLSQSDTEKIIQSMSLDIPIKIRNLAIILLMVRLGLRAGDVANLQLDHINWPNGTLLVNGKNKIDYLLPLPQEVGDAILHYLDSVRPTVPNKAIFICLNAPYRSLTPVAVTSIARREIIASGIKNPPSLGAHVFRHTAATDLLRSGVTLQAVSSILRHRHLNMTGHYAKVDMPSLMSITQAWPEYSLC